MKQLLYTHLFLFIALLTVNQSFSQEDALFIDKSGNVGIGTSTPKNKFSVNGSADFAGDVGIGTTTSPKKLSVNGKADFSGNVGIGTTSPQQNLSVNGGMNIDQADNNNGIFSSTSSATQSVLSFGSGSGEGIASNRKSVNGNQYGLDFYTAFTKRMSISNSGNIGIGTNSPDYLLHIVLKGNNRNILKLENSNTNTGFATQIYYANVGGNWEVGTNNMGNGTNNNQFYIYDTDGNYRLTVQKGTGNVGIGTTSPTQGKLVVKGYIDNYNLYYSYFKEGKTSAGAISGNIYADIDRTTATSPASVYADNRILCPEFNAFSDSRIKKDFQKSDIAQDLETLRKIAITDYYYKDGLQHGFAQKKGIIAQEVEAVFPQAVNKHSDYISDIFAMPIHTNLVETTLTVSMEKEHGLKNGDKVRLITPNEVAEVEIAVMNDKSFIVKDWDKKTTEVFVYGKLVDDFRSVDFDRLTILSISGVQQLCKEMEAMKAELQQTKDLFSKELAELKKDMQSLDAKVSNTKSNASR